MARRYTKPRPADLRPGARYGQHVLTDRDVHSPRAEEWTIQSLAATMFRPDSPWPPCHPVLVRQLLDQAPRRGRDAWLRRADEVCRAWGRPLLGSRGLARQRGAR